MEIVADCTFGVSKITADGDCSHEIKRHLLLGRTIMTNLDSILKSRMQDAWGWYTGMTWRDGVGVGDVVGGFGIGNTCTPLVDAC